MNIHVIQKSPEEVAQALAEALLKHSAAEPKIALFLSGGSAISIYEHLVLLAEQRTMGSLVLGLVDERFSLDTAYLNSNFFQIDTQTELFKRARELYHDIIPVLEGQPFLETVALYNRRLMNLWTNGFTKMAILGVGPDGHTAGILPNPDKAVFDHTFQTGELVVGYENAGDFPQRITLTPKALKAIDQVYVFAIGDNKKKALTRLRADRPLNDTPAALLHQLDHVELFTDQPL